MATCLEPHPDKPQKSVEKLINKITPFLETISKASKATTADTVSENRSSVSKAEKNISPFFRTVNTDLLNKLQKDSSPGIAKHDITLTIRELIGIGRVDKVFGEAEYILLEKVLEKYFDNDVLTRERNHNWEGSSIPHKVLNVLNYELIEFEFI